MELQESASRARGTAAGTAFDAAAPGAWAGAQTAAETAAGRIRRRFVVLATPRTGSSHLVALLDAHPQLRCLGELFNPKGTVLRELGLRNKKVLTQAGETPVAYLEQIIATIAQQDDCKPQFGFKLMLHHDPRMIDHVLDDPQWSVIVLERRDLLGQWTSMALAKKTGRWDLGPGRAKSQAAAAARGDDAADDGDEDEDPDADGCAGAAPAPPGAPRKVIFDAWKFEQYCFRIRARYASIYHRLGRRSHFRLATEEIDAAHADLLQFLGADPRPLGPAGPRQNAVSMRDRIENYEHYARYARRHRMPVA